MKQEACHRLAEFIKEFIAITGLCPSLDPAYRARIDKLVAFITSRQVLPFRLRRAALIAHMNEKFLLNAAPLRRFYRAAAHAGFTFDYHEKNKIEGAFNNNDSHRLVTVLNRRSVPSEIKQRLMALFLPMDESRTINHIALECERPSQLRTDKLDRNIRSQITKSLFSAFLWESLARRQMHEFFDPHYEDSEYVESFWDQLHLRSPHLFSRKNALHIVRLQRDKMLHTASIRASISHTIERLYHVVDNYGFLALVIDSVRVGEVAFEWLLASEAVLFAEKHREIALKSGYFRWKRVERETLSHIPLLKPEAARFDIANEGFTYRDCFVLTVNNSVSRLVVILQKNHRDETPIPCPTCRSTEVQGNSYPMLGVRSWECRNVLCPDRSKYNRGKRYSFRALVMQHAIEDPRNEIPGSSIRRWLRDVLSDHGDNELANMLVRHYSMYGDVVHVHNWSAVRRLDTDRRIEHHQLAISGTPHSFWHGRFFQRYLVDVNKTAAYPSNIGHDDFKVLVGDAADVLRGFVEGAFDGAVTSPPYYNARQYSQWPNVYCYLHDMYDVNRQVYRTLKPGSLYLYNIFDYFDNERTIVFSAMGQRRMLLSAYTVHMFQYIGFRLIGNIVWDKGDIEGKRGYNSGNLSPYYQSPFNCWEHVLAFRKPEREPSNNDAIIRYRSSELEAVSEVLRVRPVVKMVRGDNVHGHSAPFPDALPELLISHMHPNTVVLDPFAGSLTTGRVAQRCGVRSVCIDRSEKYCKLGLRLWREEQAADASRHSQLELF